MVSPHIAVIDYGAGNLHSVEKALRFVLRDHEATLELVSDGASLQSATHIVLPGVGAFADCMAGLRALPQMVLALEQAVMQQKKPFLGICVGMQMLFEQGLEHGEYQGLGWIEGNVIALKDHGGKAACSSLKIPHMGWNDLTVCRDHALCEGVQTGDHAYFVHSYHCVPKRAEDVLLTVEYGAPIIAAIQRDNIMATQFHPEKSQRTGLRLLQNFVELPVE